MEPLGLRNSSPAAPSSAMSKSSIDNSARHHKSPQDPSPLICPASPSPSPYSRRYFDRARRHSVPFSLPPLVQQSPPSTSAVSLVPSTAQGKPIPLDQETTSNRTSALRELNSNYPSKHRYAKSAGAQSTTYSQPVIVKTYSGPSSRPASATRGGRPSKSSRLKYPFSSASTTQSTPAVRNVGPGFLNSSMARPKHMAPGRKRFGRSDNHPARLPPVEAFSFKSFVADVSMQQDISNDLDRIAEICARSRYSLSNQYEVHMAPHGSGAAFLANQVSVRGPTLQAVSSDEERSHRKKRTMGRRRSMAYGTLETIMSSSRSSDEDKKGKKKGAEEIARNVGERATAEILDVGDATSTVSGSDKMQNIHGSQSPANSQEVKDAERIVRKKSPSFATAIIDSSRHHGSQPPPVSGEAFQDVSSTKNSNNSLHSEPALPQTSKSHLEIRTAPEANGRGTAHMHESRPESTPESDKAFDPLSLMPFEEAGTCQNAGILSSLGSWVPWGGYRNNAALDGQRRNGAEGSLRELLRHSDSKPVKGKATEGS